MRVKRARLPGLAEGSAGVGGAGNGRLADGQNPVCQSTAARWRISSPGPARLSRPAHNPRVLLPVTPAPVTPGPPGPPGPPSPDGLLTLWKISGTAGRQCLVGTGGRCWRRAGGAKGGRGLRWCFMMEGLPGGRGVSQRGVRGLERCPGTGEGV